MNRIFLIKKVGAGLENFSPNEHYFWCPDDNAFRPLRYCIFWGSGVFMNAADANGVIKANNIPDGEIVEIVGYSLEYMGIFNV